MITKKKEISSKNQIISLLETGNYIKNPLVYSQLRGDLSKIQTDIYVAVVAAMQERINYVITNHKQGEQWNDRDLFSEKEHKRELFNFEIPLASLNINAKDYDLVEDTCRKMQERSFTYRYKDSKGDWVTVISSIFTKIEIPYNESSNGFKRRVGNIKVEMKTEVAELLFSLRTGYVTHLADIVPKCKNSKTPRLYIYLSSLNENRLYKGEGQIDYNELKEFFGILTYTSSKRTEIKEDRYKMYSYFRRDVLEPIKKELDSLKEKGEVEFSFTYEPIYLNGRKRGNPDKIKFTLNPPVVAEAEVTEIKSGDFFASYKEVANKKESIFTPLEKLDLYNKLIEIGNEWALSMQGKPFIEDDFERELKRENLI